MSFDLKPRPFPNRHALLQLVDNPLACQEAFASMRTRHSQKQRWFSSCNETNSMVNDNQVKPKSLCGSFGNSFQLVLGHFMMRLIIDSLNSSAVLNWSDYAPEINDRACAGDVARRRRKRCLCN